MRRHGAVFPLKAIDLAADEQGAGHHTFGMQSGGYMRGRYGFFLGAATTLVWGLAATGMYFLYVAPPTPPAPPRLQGEIIRGPWGQLEALPVPLLNTSGQLPDAEARLGVTTWYFPYTSEPELRRFLGTATRDYPRGVALLNPIYWTAHSNGWTITPPRDVVLQLPPEARAKIYSALAKDQRNYAQQHPFRFPLSGFEPCLAAAGLPRTSIDRLRALTYTNEATLCLADLAAAKEWLSPHEFEQLTEVLYQQPSYRLRLFVAENEDVEPLVRYWGAGGREELVRPLLKSLAFVPGGASTSVSALLPPFARLRLFTFPVAWKDPAIEREDCFFTTLNFFNMVPDTNFASQAHVEHTLRTEYAPVLDAPVFGDVAAVLDAQSRIVHCSMYLAADFVFTKNGVSPTQPWVIMHASEMLRSYSNAGSSRLVYLRKTAAQGIAASN
jgi:hypothetical protein